MNELYNIRQDCRFLILDRPCKFHKKEGVVCNSCSYFKKIHTRILVIKLDALGDVLRTMAILPPLKKKYPDSHITWITRENAVPLFKNVELVDEVLDYSDPVATHLLQTSTFDLVINPDANKASALMASVVKAKEKKGFYLGSSTEIIASNDRTYEWFLMGINDGIKKKNTKTYQQIILDMLDLDENDSYIPLSLSSKEKENSENFCKGKGFDGKKTIIGLNIGAGGRWQNKVWPIGHYEELIKGLLKRNMQILLLGGVNEKKRLAALNNRFADRIASGSYDNSLREFFSVLNVCDVLVSSDTMAAHAGLALGKKLVVLFGPTSINEFEVYGRGIKLCSDIDCIVCYRPTCDKKPNCMDLLKPEVVENAVARFFKNDKLVNYKE